jgi:hypothetical protein
VITERGLADLRLAAALTHLHPSLVLQVLDGHRPVVRVAGPVPIEPADGIRRPGAALQLTPCAFRGAVASAFAALRSGSRLQMLDLPADPVVELGAGTRGRVLPGGIARVHDGLTDSWVMATFLPPERCRHLAHDILRQRPAPEGVLELALCRDSDLDVTVVSAELDPAGPVDEPAVVDLLEELLARFVTEELLEVMARSTTGP